MRPFKILVLLLVATCFHPTLPAVEPVPLAERSFHVIRGTESPDKQFALAWGLATDRARDGQPRLNKEDPASEPPTADLEEASVCNYLVDFGTQSILAETGAKHASAAPTYNQNGCTAHWSSDSRTVVQVTTFKDRYSQATLLRIDASGRQASTPFDLRSVVEARATAFLKQKKNRAFGRHEEFAILLLHPVVANDAVALTVWGEVVGKPGRDYCWGLRVKAGVTMTDKHEIRAGPVSVRYLHEGTEVETAVSHHSPDGKYAMQTVHEAGHELWSSLFIHRLELVTLPEKRVVAQLLPAAEVGTNFSAPRLLWSPDSHWCAFHFEYPDRGEYRSGYPIAFRRTGEKFVALNPPRQIRADVLRDKREGRLNENVLPVRWKEPGILILKQAWQLVWDTEEPADLAWEMEAAYDAKKRVMKVGRVTKLSPEEAARLDEEITATAPARP